MRAKMNNPTQWSRNRIGRVSKCVKEKEKVKLAVAEGHPVGSRAGEKTKKDEEREINKGRQSAAERTKRKRENNRRDLGNKRKETEEGKEKLKDTMQQEDKLVRCVIPRKKRKHERRKGGWTPRCRDRREEGCEEE